MRCRPTPRPTTCHLLLKTRSPPKTTCGRCARAWPMLRHANGSRTRSTDPFRLPAEQHIGFRPDPAARVTVRAEWPLRMQLPVHTFGWEAVEMRAAVVVALMTMVLFVIPPSAAGAGSQRVGA